jgi:hypothetical protein
MKFRKGLVGFDWNLFFICITSVTDLSNYKNLDSHQVDLDGNHPHSTSISPILS